MRNVDSTGHSDPVDQARKKFLDDGETEFQGGTLSAEGHQLAKAAVSPGKPGAQVSTFAVDGVQSNDMMVVKRVPPTADGPNFVLYMPENDVTSFHEFKTAEEMTEWVKSVANDPTERKRFTQHFSSAQAPKQEERVSQKMGEFAAGDVNVAVGSFGYEKGDIFQRLNKDASAPPVEVDGLVRTQLYKLEPDGKAFYIGYREDGEAIIYSYDAYGNLHGGGQKKDADNKRYYFVPNGLNDNKPLEPITFNQFREKITSASLDNVGANNLSGLYDEFLKQLRNPGHGLGTALKVFGFPDDLADAIEKLVKNPSKDGLLELNKDNRIGLLLGVDKDKVDGLLENIYSDAQNHSQNYEAARGVLNAAADKFEKLFGKPVEPTTQVRT